jgi:hypothetical protein
MKKKLPYEPPSIQSPFSQGIDLRPVMGATGLPCQTGDHAGTICEQGTAPSSCAAGKSATSECPDGTGVSDCRDGHGPAACVPGTTPALCEKGADVTVDCLDGNAAANVCSLGEGGPEPPPG